MDNRRLASFFWDIAKLLEFRQEDIFRIRSYQKAAQAIEDHPVPLEESFRSKGADAFKGIPGIGKSISEKIEEALVDGEPALLKELKKKAPKGILELMEVNGIGPKLARLLYKELKIGSVPQLEKAAAAGKLKGLPGIEEKKQENLLKAARIFLSKKGKVYLGEALSLAKSLLKELRSKISLDEAVICGSLRRMKEEIGDIDILASSKDHERAIGSFTKLPQVRRVLSKGTTKASVVLENLMNADLRVVPPNMAGSAIHYFTGSKQHNIRLRRLAIEKGLKLNEYGLFKNKKRIAGRTEEELFAALGLEFIPPELREDAGEVEKAKERSLPRLVEQKDIRGDLHVHSNYSDGKRSIEQMAAGAMALGYEYMAVTDHSKSSVIAGGLSRKELTTQMKEIDAINKKLKGFRVLKGVEVDILGNGSLDLEDDLLEELDIVVASIHSRFGMKKEEMTERLIKAMENRNVDIIGHPTGRLLDRREPYEINMEELIEAAAATGTALELNASPNRLDLNASHCRVAVSKGVKIAINTDSHDTDQFSFMELGIGTARRGWVEKGTVLNCLPLAGLIKALSA